MSSNILLNKQFYKYLETKYADYTEVRHSFRNLKINQKRYKYYYIESLYISVRPQ